MADVIKKAIVPHSILTELDWEAEGYLIRYRIKSENKNLSSHWSPIYLVPFAGYDVVEANYFETVGEDGKTNVTVVWDDVVMEHADMYDIFVAFRGITLPNTFEYDGDIFVYHGQTSVHNYSFIKKEGTTSYRIIIQAAADKKIIKDRFVIYDSDNPITAS